MASDPRIYAAGEKPENVYLPNRMPYEKLNAMLREEGVGDVARQQIREGDDDIAHFHEFVRHIRKERKRLGKADHSEEKIKAHLIAHGRQMGMGDAEAMGFWGKLWKGIKKGASWVGKNIVAPVGKEVGKTALDIGKNALNEVAQNPIGTISKIAPMFV